MTRGTGAEPRFDAIVVGGGHNGLTAAAYLARAGLRPLVLERREIVGGCCVTEEIAPGCRASTTSYIASMLRPEVVRDLRLRAHGLRMVPCEPGLQVPFHSGRVLPWWSDPERTAREIEPLSARDARAFVGLDRRLKRVASYLEPYFLEPPPDVYARGPRRLREVLTLGRRLRGISGRGITDLFELLTGSLGDLADRHFETDEVKTLLLAGSVYGTHGGPYRPGTAMGLIFHLLSGGDHHTQGYYGHVIGGMGSIAEALASSGRALGVEIRTGVEVAAIDVREGRARGVVLDDGTEIGAAAILSGVDPKRTFLALVDGTELPGDFIDAVRAIRMDGPCAKVNLVLSEEPRVTGMPPDADPLRRSVFTILPSLEFAERCYATAMSGVIPERLWVDCVVASNVDSTLAPEGTHIMTCFVQFVPYRLAKGDWDAEREGLGDRVIQTIEDYAPGVARSVLARQVLTPLDLERTYGLTEGNIFHGDLAPERLLFMRPVPGWSRYRTPVRGLYLCGAGAHPGGGVTGAPGRNAARVAIRDLKRRTR